MKFPISLLFPNICFGKPFASAHICARIHVYIYIYRCRSVKGQFYYFSRVKNTRRRICLAILLLLPPLLAISRHTAFAFALPNLKNILASHGWRETCNAPHDSNSICSFKSGIRRGTVAFSSQPDLEPDTGRRSLADIYKLHQRRETEGANRLGVFQRFFSLFGSRPSSRKTSIASFTGTYTRGCV